VTERLLADATARVVAAAPATAPEIAPEIVEGLVHDYLQAAEPDDLAVFTAADVAGAVLSMLGASEPVVRVGNPTLAVEG
jgi:hypothetical protein